MMNRWTEEKGKEEEGGDDWDGINTQVGRNELEEMDFGIERTVCMY